MSNILSGKKLDSFMKEAIDMASEWISIHEWEKEKMDRLVLENAIEQNTVQTIKSMLENNIDYDLISKVNGKSIDEIKKIEETIH